VATNLSDSISDYDLVLLIRDGKHDYMRSLISRYNNYIKSVVFKYYIPGFDNSDIMQEAYIGLYRAVLTYDPAKTSSFRSFVNVCVKGSIISALTLAKRKKHMVLNDSLSLQTPLGGDEDNELISVLPDNNFPSVDHAILAEERQLYLLEYLKQSLSPLEFSIMMLYSRSISMTEISSITGASFKSIDNTIQRVKNKLVRHQNRPDKKWKY
jgi:RNA polymerase sporulation-specific sigma factor